MITSLIHLILLLAFFSLLGLGVASTKMVRERVALLPTLGFGAVIALGYVLSANLKLSGAVAVSYAVVILLTSVLIRSPRLFQALRATWQTGSLSRSLFIPLIPIFTLLLPALFYGFNFFYGSVNFDFFYNSQESWFLKTHHVLQFASAAGEEILPLSWSSNFQGRFGVSLWAAFFSYWMQVDTLQFNSLLLNAQVVLFALCMGVFSKEFFGFKTKGVFFAVFFSVMSAGFVQSYSYYLLGQLSAIPLFIVYAIVLKSVLDKASDGEGAVFARTKGEVVALALLFNVLYIFYAILGFFALLLTFVSYAVCCYRERRKSTLYSFIQIMAVAVFVFGLIRLSAVSESMAIVNEWVATSGKVASGGTAVIVFSEYLKDAFLALLLGITNYPSTVSIFGLFITLAPVRNYLLFILGIAALTTLLLSLKVYVTARDNSKGAHAVIVGLAIIIITCASYFFFTLASYGIFKIQTWFMPLLIPLYLYAFNKKVRLGSAHLSLSVLCGTLLVLNLAAGLVYMADFIVPDQFKRYANVRGITGNKDVLDLATKLNSDQPKAMSLMLTNGIEAAWLANFTRAIPLKMVAHNYQPLADKEFPSQPCAYPQDHNLTADNLWIMTNPRSVRSEITDAPQGGKVMYENESYLVLDPAQVSSLVYFGKGAYPLELNTSRNTTFPPKFRWVGKGVEVMIYSQQARMADLVFEVMPGYVVTKSPVRQISVKTETKQYDFSFQSKTTLTVPRVALRKGLTCVVLESQDDVSQPRTAYGIMRAGIPLDTRLINFAVSYVGIK